jgi:NitT/TauT family transport system substrate-binding protein
MRPLITRRRLVAGAAASAAPSSLRGARAAAGEIRTAHQIGLSYLPITVMKARGLVENEARKRGANLTASYLRFANGSSVNDALISQNADFGTVSLGPLLALWDHTRTTLRVKGVGAVDASGAVLNTNQPRIKSLRDLTENDRIAMPDVGVSYQALLLQMACEKEFGEGESRRLDHLTVSLPHPEAATALLGGRSEITAHFATAPFLFQERVSGKVTPILSSPDILGGPGTFVILISSQRYRAENRVAFETVLAALGAAQKWIAANPEDAAGIYIAAENSKLQPDFIVRMLRDPLVRYGLVPENTMRIADFSYRTGRIKSKVDGWQDIFFEDIHGLAGS